MTNSADDEPIQNGYDRPVGAWTCGHTDGTECLLGPTGLGVCQATGACSPRRDGDRWQCNRPPIRGGSCDVGPTPDGQCQCVTESCSPQRSVRSNRYAFAFGCFAFTLGALLIVLNTNQRREFLAPGQLTTQHAQILTSPEVENRCAACHPSGNDSTSAWIAQTLGLPTKSKTTNGESSSPGATETTHVGIHRNGTMPLDHQQISQTDLCMKCHEHTIDPIHARKAHNLPTDLLAAITAKQKSRDAELQQDQDASGFQFVSFSSPANANGDLACSACHREHHGSKHDLAQLTNAQCQSCHADQFHSFEVGHPEFVGWPYRRRQRIAFDHASHSGKYFKNESREFNCDSCHKSTDQPDVVSVTSYSTCADCHEKDIHRSVEEGLTIFQLPTIDSLALDDAGFDIGQWPAKADGEFDGALPEVMKLLLAADERALEAFDALGSDFEFYEADVDDEEQMEALAKLVWAIKRLLNELAVDPAQAWRTRMMCVLNRKLDPIGLHHLQTSYSKSHFDSCSAAWFTDLAEDLRLEFDGQVALAQANPKAASLQPSYGTSIRRTAPVQVRSEAKIGWQVDLDSYRVDYIPEGHGDEFLAMLLDLLATTSKEQAEEVVDDVRASFLTSNSIGTCISCHSLDQQDAAQIVNWKSKGKTRGPSFAGGDSLTQFSHRQHLIQPNLSDCSHCHQLDFSADFKTAFKDPGNVHSNFTSNFRNVKKAQCIGCHNQQTSKDSCTTCHDYHVHPKTTEGIGIPRLAESERSTIR